MLLDLDPAPAEPDARPRRIGCTLPQVFVDTKVGHRIFFDDGKIGGVVEEAGPEELRIRITDADPRGTRLGSAKGINLPDTELRLPALTDDDLAHLPFVAAHADAVSLSFVRSATDVRLLQDRLAEVGGGHLGIVLKVETVSGFENLPSILFAAMHSSRVGVMIARGDLAVEAGYGRLAEVQEEILWLCQAAHVPVIWATQVLDSLARTGRPSRAEVTDAAASGRAECVMLNKGPFVDHAVRFLDEVLLRMAEHQRKKDSLLRRLRAWDTPPLAASADTAVAGAATVRLIER
nr:pyruvate kinase [Rhodococcus sp. CC-R104]